ncbi:MAG: glycosyltransferase family 39 protein [Ardenticatenia bacterium]|nr:glycosyltransferase family 39 protein [Ardenticatenia bacterium]
MNTSRSAPGRGSWLSWPVVVLAVAALALAARLPALQLVPHLTDESAEVLYARDILVAGTRPLVHTDAYNGAFWAWLMAGWIKLWPADPQAPRLLSLALGLATVLATVALAARLARPDRRLPAGLLGGALMATAFTPALVNSRVAWSNSSTPLWTTLGVLALLAAVTREAGGREAALRWLGAGLLGGVALHTHPSVIVFLAGLALWLFLAGRRLGWLARSGPWLALLGAALAYGPVIYFNLTGGMATLHEAQSSGNWAAAGSWAAGAHAAFLQLGRSFVGGFGLVGASTTLGERLLAALWATAFLGAALWLALAPVKGLAEDEARPVGRRLPLLVTLLALLALPRFNQNWQGFLEARYLGFLLPLLSASLGAVLAERLPERGAATGTSLRTVRWTASLRALVMAALIALPLLRGWTYIRSAMAEQFDNRRLWSMLESARGGRAAGAVLLVDEDLKSVRWRAGGHPRRAVTYLLTMADLPFEQLPPATINHRLDAGGAPAPLCFLAGATAESLTDWGRSLSPLDITARPGEDPWGLWTVATPAAAR